MRSFPVTTIYRDNMAVFYLDGYRIVVPAMLGSNDNRLHVIRWLHHAWPFRVKVGPRGPRLIKTQDGKEIALHKVYSELVHGDAFVVEAADGNLLRWTPENIGPRRKPAKIVPPGSQANEVSNQMYHREQEGTLKRYIRQEAQLLKTSEGVLTSAQLAEAQAEPSSGQRSGSVNSPRYARAEMQTQIASGTTNTKSLRNCSIGERAHSRRTTVANRKPMTRKSTA